MWLMKIAMVAFNTYAGLSYEQWSYLYSLDWSENVWWEASRMTAVLISQFSDMEFVHQC